MVVESVYVRAMFLFLFKEPFIPQNFVSTHYRLFSRKVTPLNVDGQDSFTTERQCRHEVRVITHSLLLHNWHALELNQ